MMSTVVSNSWTRTSRSLDRSALTVYVHSRKYVYCMHVYNRDTLGSLGVGSYMLILSTCVVFEVTARQRGGLELYQ